ncbi:MAG TPA: AmmeMemoRadiSam system protein A [Acidimicrobiales bacterium]|jgi:AmmeMemoRadiSam system protein A|nr:AmmeMemoRadiSam system protein A [Acidimicrobiales bacterium]
MEPSLSPDEINALFALADLGVRAGLAGRPAPAVDAAVLAPALRQSVGVFVTLEVAGELNGCIGTIEADEPLGAAVPRLAWAAAFADPRLPALTPEQYRALEIKLSILTPLTPVPAASEEEVVAALRPGVDGLLIRSGADNATFLPAVWAKVPDPQAFLRRLEAKAGLRPGTWPAGMRAWRYQASEHRRRAVDIDSSASSAA